MKALVEIPVMAGRVGQPRFNKFCITTQLCLIEPNSARLLLLIMRNQIIVAANEDASRSDIYS